MTIFFFVIVLIFSVIIHEISHGYAALYLGDSTAKDAGRLTLNPLKHIDLFGSIIVPLFLALASGPVFGWAKPVPYNPRFLKNPKKAGGLIAAAGPISNLIVAVIFSIFVRVLVNLPAGDISVQLFLFFNIIIQVNIALAIFNLLPIPPLDGSGVLFSLLPRQYAGFERFMRQYGFIILLILIFSGLSFLGPLILGIHAFLIGEASLFIF